MNPHTFVFFFTLSSIVNSNCTHYSRVARMYVFQGGIMRGAFRMECKDQVEPDLARSLDGDR